MSRINTLSYRITSFLETFKMPPDLIEMVLPFNFVHGILKVLQICNMLLYFREVVTMLLAVDRSLQSLQVCHVLLD